MARFFNWHHITLRKSVQAFLTVIILLIWILVYDKLQYAKTHKVSNVQKLIMLYFSHETNSTVQENTVTIRSMDINNNVHLIVHNNGIYKYGQKVKLTNAFSHDTSLFRMWRSSSFNLCSDNMFTGYANQFAYLQWIYVDPTKFLGQKGGQDMEKVMNQHESVEYYKFQYGCFQISCFSERTLYRFNGGNNHINTYLMNTKFMANKLKAIDNDIKLGFTIAVTRYEYVNIYHTMTDWYNAFLVMTFFNKTASETNILIIDAHPAGSLDSTWDVLFNSSTRVAFLNGKTTFKEMAWNIIGYNSPVSIHSGIGKLPLAEEFREFFLQQHRVEINQGLNCDKLKIVFIWRRDYVAHPRNPTGQVERKIKNEGQILNHFVKKFPSYNVTGIQMDALSMTDQLKIIANTDILIGMHGAGLTHAMFLPRHATLIELFPQYVSMDNTHFQQIAKWRGLNYLNWNNLDDTYELPGKYTYIKHEEIGKLLDTALYNIKCGHIK